MKDSNISFFAKKVYQTVSKIPLGEVRSYKWVADKAGRPKAFRAIGQILKKNPFPITIPCHRVIKSNGELGGYAWGLAKKKKLLQIENKIKNNNT